MTQRSFRAILQCAAAILAATALLPAQSTQQPIKIVLVGDSTVATGGGWGPGFCALLAPGVACIDHALNGRSSKSFIREGAWQRALSEKGQYYFIQFGHNDQKPGESRHTDPKTTYPQTLRRYIEEARAIGGVPILVSPLSRRNYRDGQLVKDGLADYAAAARQLAAEEHVPFVDLYRLSHELLAGMTQQQADQFDMQGHPDAKAENDSATRPDRTHLNEHGKAVFGQMVATEVKRVLPVLAPYING
jgi:lysophospholipase L1-like esterase